MKKLPLAVLISAGAHLVVVGAAVAYEPDPPREKPANHANPIELLPVTEPESEPESEPVAIILFDDAAENLVASAAPAPTHSTMDRNAPARVVAPHAVTTHATDTIVTPDTKHEPHQPHSMFTMRDKRAAVFSFRVPKHDDLDRAPAGTKPIEEAPRTGKLQPSGNGTYRSNEGVFTARVERDGSVNLENARNLRITAWPDPRKIAKIPGAVGNGIASWYAKDDKTPQDPERQPINNARAVEKDTRPDHGQTTTVPILGGGFDITDAFMRRKKIDPYASRKLAYLDSTRDERVQIGKRYRKEQLAKSAELMQKQLDLVWASAATIQAKKQALFELWEDCAESGEAAVVEGGRAARRLVIGFIRAKLPKGSASAFTEAELVTLDTKRTSKAAFEPYRRQAGRR